MQRSFTSRRMAPVVLLASAALLLTGCGSSAKSTTSTPSASTSPSAAPAYDPCTLGSGSTSDSVKVAGAFGKTATATFSKPLSSSSAQRTVVTKGTGAMTKAPDQLDLSISLFVGSSGKSVGTQAVSLKVGDSTMIKAFAAGFSCVPIGSRVVVTSPASDMYGSTGNPQLGITGTDSVVIVTDVLGLKKQLKPAAWTTNQPTVTFAANGKPTVKLPKIKPLKALLLEVLRPGTGAVVHAGDTVTLNYQGTSWDTGKVFDQSYGRAVASFPTDKVVEGFGAALVGQKVGTRLVVTIPPKYAYGEKGSGQALSGQTLVFVIEIKATKAP